MRLKDIIHQVNTVCDWQRPVTDPRVIVAQLTPVNRIEFVQNLYIEVFGLPLSERANTHLVELDDCCDLIAASDAELWKALHKTLSC